ncbi:hypothetical protein EXIGLDRAFT_761692 [Exidia glandulosa HHB12029]|uniref:Uncharacterized protein n=1 Tax=Exidia glandulosa HHB12029 TaxID=1314781 RepID=A0A166BEH1_EXIGL|nr:hypothetical protein EXIGLDRAFT_761692 [Exidia glandulosa HHB12029]
MFLESQTSTLCKRRSSDGSCVSCSVLGAGTSSSRALAASGSTRRALDGTVKHVLDNSALDSAFRSAAYSSGRPAPVPSTALTSTGTRCTVQNVLLGRRARSAPRNRPASTRPNGMHIHMFDTLRIEHAIRVFTCVGRTTMRTWALRYIASKTAIIPGKQYLRWFLHAVHVHKGLKDGASAEEVKLEETGPQLFALRSRIQAFKLIQRGVSISDVLQEAIHPEGSLANDAHTSRPVLFRPGRTSMTTPRLPSTRTTLSPTHSRTWHNPTPRTRYGRPRRSLLLPSIIPPGLDLHQSLAECVRFVEARIEQRIRGLAVLPSTMGEGGLEHPVEDAKPDVTASPRTASCVP